MTWHKRAKHDCVRQCVARVVGRPWHSVPHFVKRSKRAWRIDLQAWCDRIGYNCVICYSSATKPARANTTWRTPTHIAIGMTWDGTSHAVVRSAEGRVVYDGGHPLRFCNQLILIWKRDA